MKETSQQYVARLLGYVGKKDPIDILSTTPKKIARYILQASKKSIYKKPTPRKWSVNEIIAHLAETELVMGWRYRSVAGKNGIRIQAYEQDDWAKNARYQQCNVFEMFEIFKVIRFANLLFLRGLPKKKLKNYGMHEERGKETIAHIMRLEAGHDLNHLRQIERILKK